MQNFDMDQINDIERSIEVDAKRRQARFLLGYTVTLFFAALILILLSAMMQNKNTDELQNSNSDSIITQDEHETLLLEIDSLKELLVEKDEIISGLTYELENLRNN